MVQNMIISSSSSVSDLHKSSLVPDIKSNASGQYVCHQKDDVNAASILDQQDDILLQIFALLDLIKIESQILSIKKFFVCFCGDWYTYQWCQSLWN